MDADDAVLVDAARLYGHFDVQHGADPLEGVFTYDRAWPIDLSSWKAKGEDGDGGPADAAPPEGQLRLTLAQLPDRALVRLFAHYVWNAALVLAALVDHGRVPVRGRRVIELGAGAGLPGVVAALRGAVDVVLTDYPAPYFLDNLTANIERNLPALAAGRHVHVLGHAWGTPVDALLAAGEGTARFDAVLLADVLWMPDLHGALLDSCRRLVRPAAEGGRVWLAFGKHTGEHITDAFLALAASPAHGFTVQPLWEYKFATEWGGPETRLDAYNETRRTVYVYLLSHPDPETGFS